MVAQFKKKRSDPEIQWNIMVMSSQKKLQYEVKLKDGVYHVFMAIGSVDLLPYFTPQIRDEIYKHHTSHNIE